MSTPSSSEKLRRNLYLKNYLKELGALTGRTVQADELGSLEQAASIRTEAQKFINQPPTVCEIRFSDRCSERFKEFLQRLKDANSLPVYVWTEHTIDCGALLVPSIDTIKFDFDFAINDEGILAFITRDLGDSLLLDFSSTPMDEQVMKIETRGANWGTVIY